MTARLTCSVQLLDLAEQCVGVPLNASDPWREEPAHALVWGQERSSPAGASPGGSARLTVWPGACWRPIEDGEPEPTWLNRPLLRHGQRDAPRIIGGRIINWLVTNPCGLALRRHASPQHPSARELHASPPMLSPSRSRSGPIRSDSCASSACYGRGAAVDAWSSPRIPALLALTPVVGVAHCSRVRQPTAHEGESMMRRLGGSQGDGVVWMGLVASSPGATEVFPHCHSREHHAVVLSTGVDLSDSRNEVIQRNQRRPIAWSWPWLQP